MKKVSFCFIFVGMFIFLSNCVFSVSSVDLLSPANNSYSNNPSQNFIANLSGDNGILNATLFIYNSSNSELICSETQTDFNSFFSPGYALEFDGVNDYVDCGDGARGYSNMTISFWINPSVRKAGGLLYKTSSYTASGINYYVFWWGNNLGIQVGFSNGGSAFLINLGGTDVIIPGEWQLVTLVKAGTRVSVYRNGEFLRIQQITTQ